MKPGDLIEWYKYDDVVVVKDERLWSYIMKRWVPIGEIAILLYRNDKTYGWINSKGVFHARSDDTSITSGFAAMRTVIQCT